MTDAEWPSLKPQMPYKQLPVLEVTPPGGDKVMLAESVAIARLLARTFNLYGNDAKEIYLIERMNSLVRYSPYNFDLTILLILSFHTKDSFKFQF